MEEDKVAAMQAAYKLMWNKPTKTMEEIKLEFNEAMLRWYVYGSVEEVDPCDIYERLMSRNTYKDRFPRVFAYSIIIHLTRCKICGDKYHGDHSVSEVPTPQDA